MKTRMAVAATLLAGMCLAKATQAENDAVPERQPANLKELAANTFVELPNPSPNRPTWIDPVHAADAGILVGVNRPKQNQPVQTLHFNFDSGQWECQGVDTPAGVNPRAGRRTSPGVYDSRRKRVVFGGRWSYDPVAKTWEDLNVSTELYGKTYPGSPHVQNANMVYDPVNDEIMLFGAQGMANWDEWADSGRLSGHLGTLVLSMGDRVWRRLDPGGAAIRQARDEVYNLYVRQWNLTEQLAVLRRLGYRDGLDKAKPDIAGLAAPQRALAEDSRALAFALAGRQGEDAYETSQLQAAAKALHRATEAMNGSARELAAGQIAPALNRGDLFRALESVRHGDLAVEPPARAEAPMVYDPRHKVIVMFGGYVGNRSENDTWIYECEKRRWMRRIPEIVPPPRLNHILYRHDPSGLIVMVGGKWAIPSGGGAGTSFRSLKDIWTYDVAANRWQRVEGIAPQINVGYMYGLHYANGAYAAAQDVLVYTGTGKQAQAFRFAPGNALPPLDLNEAVYVSRNDRFPYEQTPETYRDLPPDKPDTGKLLTDLPANTWTELPIEGGGNRREWCILSRDATRGYGVYFGGGHSTYMGDDIDLFLPGALAWMPSHRAFNTQIAPSGGWPNFLPQFNGGPAVTHTRDQYTAMDGVFMLFEYWSFAGIFYGPEQAVAYVEAMAPWRDLDYLKGHLPFLFRYDIEGSRTWTVSFMPTEIRNFQPMMAFPSLVRFATLHLETRRGKACTWATVDMNGSDPQVVPIPEPWPDLALGEGQHMGPLTKRNQVMLIGTGRESGVPETWVYDIAENRWNQIEPKRNFPGPIERSRAVVYCDDQDAVLANVLIKDSKENAYWAYSFRHNAWAPFPEEGADLRRFRDHGGPRWSQLVYLPKHKVFMLGARPGLLRPDFSLVEWDRP